jgi:hypothetical protein
MKKLSVSIDDELAARAALRAEQVADGNVSLLAAAAIRRVLEIPANDLLRLVALQRFDRRAATREAWMRAYWHVLSDLMGRPEMDVIDNPYGPRQFSDFYAVLLLNHMGRADDENDPFIPHIGPSPVTPQSPAPCQWTFKRSSSPVVAAETVASKLREYGVFPQTREGGE